MDGYVPCDSAIINNPSSVDSLRFHIVPRLGKRRLDEVTYAVIEDFKLALARTPINTGKTYVGVKLDAKSKKTLSGKTINNVLTVLRRMLVGARKHGLIENVLDVEWLKREQPREVAARFIPRCAISVEESGNGWSAYE